MAMRTPHTILSACWLPTWLLATNRQVEASTVRRELSAAKAGQKTPHHRRFGNQNRQEITTISLPVRVLR
jgi:hypothetical protein